MHCDDGSLPSSSIVATHGERFLKCGERAGMPLDTIDHMKARIKAAGFQNVHVQDYKIPIGSWPKHPIFKDCGRVKVKEVLAGVEGWVSHTSLHSVPEANRPLSASTYSPNLDRTSRGALKNRRRIWMSSRKKSKTPSIILMSRRSEERRVGKECPV